MQDNWERTTHLPIANAYDYAFSRQKRVKIDPMHIYSSLVNECSPKSHFMLVYLELNAAKFTFWSKALGALLAV